jgi:hypothetical protein
MSGSSRNISRAGNAKGTNYTPPSAERKLEKKLAAAERDCQLMTATPVTGLKVEVNEKVLGDGAMILHIGQVGGLTAQMVIHRPIGNAPIDVVSDWALSNKTSISNLIGQGNPFEKKTQQIVTELKINHGLKAGTLIKNESGFIAYPDGTVRDTMLTRCRELHDTHKSVEGGKPLRPIFVYGSTAVMQQEMDFLNSLAAAPGLEATVDAETVQYREYETKDPVTGQSQVTMNWAKGIPHEQLPIVLMEVITLGKYDSAKWDKVKVLPEQKPHPFTIWGYKQGDVPQDKIVELSKAIDNYAKLKKEHNVLLPKGQKERNSETAEQKVSRLAKHEELQQAAKLVNNVEKFKRKLPERYRAHSLGKAAASSASSGAK